MQFAFSTRFMPQRTPEQIAASARELGYSGVQLSADQSAALVDSPANRAAARASFEENGLRICCLDVRENDVDGTRKNRPLDTLRKLIDVAAELGCPNVSLPGVRVRAGANRSSAAVAFGDWLLPVGVFAAERGVKVLVENGPSFRSAGEMWLILDRLGHPSIGCSWDIASGMLAGESPAVSVPTLNSRIGLVRVDDSVVDIRDTVPNKTGVSNDASRVFFTRLRGIGYGGWIVYTPSRASRDPAVASEDKSLGRTLAYLREAVAPPVQKKAGGRPTSKGTASAATIAPAVAK